MPRPKLKTGEKPNFQTKFSSGLEILKYRQYLEERVVILKYLHSLLNECLFDISPRKICMSSGIPVSRETVRIIQEELQNLIDTETQRIESFDNYIKSRFSE